jgi:glucose-1-phosphate cytidylyltransferase
MRGVILAGGLGTRLREETEMRPKPMVEIAGKPILWHLMKYLESFALKDFIVCGGYKVNFIKDYFLNYARLNNDIEVELSIPDSYKVVGEDATLDWKVLIADTGPLTNTGGRIFAVRKYLNNERFFCTYGDGLSDVDIDALMKFHASHGKIATVTVCQPESRFGLVEVENQGSVKKFSEKPQLSGWVNIGFFIFEPEIFDYLSEDCILEQGPLDELAKDGQLMAYHHKGFWQPMDTYRETLLLNKLWDEDKAPWKR